MTDNNINNHYGCKCVRFSKNPSAFGAGGIVNTMLMPTSASEYLSVVSWLLSRREHYIIVGACTNILFPDLRFITTVMSTANIKGITAQEGGLYVSAGERLGNVCAFAKNSCLSGMEELCGIPGSLGGALAMNAGSFGREIGEVVDYVDCAVADRLVRISGKELEWGYRKSLIAEKGYVVLGARLSLTEADVCAIDGRMKHCKAERLATQPQEKSLGSVFKKVGDKSAGWYIESVGLKGKIKGGAQISEKHANFIVNTGNATSKDFADLASLARQEVDKTYGIELEYEVNIL